MKAFLFGSFNPPTNAHIDMGITAQKSLRDSRHRDVNIVYVPAGDVYIKSWKGYQEGSVMPGDIRVQLLAGAVKQHRFIISGVEVAGITDGKTYNTMEYFRTLYPDEEFVLCLGMDNIPQLPKWYKWKKLLPKVRLLIFERHGEPFPTDILVKEITACAAGFDVVRLPNGDMDISSTMVRQYYLDGNMEALKEMVPENVYQYLYYNRDIYRKQKNWEGL